MTTVMLNPDITDDERRTRLYSGQVLVYSRDTGIARAGRARPQPRSPRRSAPEDPQTAQFDMRVEDFAVDC